MSEEMQEFKAFDIEGALARVGGNKDLYRKILGMFVKKYENTGVELEQLVSAGNMEEAHALAHTIKGVAGNIGAMDLFEAAKVLNVSLAKGDHTAEQLKAFKTALIWSIKAAQEI